jgi:lipoprotein-anchoring transpeptidase ErfK/SrfK
VYPRQVTCRTWLPPAVAIALLLAPASTSAGTYAQVSDERRITYSASVEVAAPVLARPSFGAKRLGQLRPDTYHGRPEVVLVLGYRELNGRQWLRIRYAGLGRRVGWVKERALSPWRLHTLLVVVDRDATELRLVRGRKVVMRVPIGVGAGASPTPPGRYYIRERLALSGTTSIYGALAFGTSAFSRYRTDWPGGGQVGIHGTNEPGLIPGHISNGCVRLRNEDVLRLGEKIDVGTPVLIK